MNKGEKSSQHSIAASFDLCGFRPADTPCWCGWENEQEDDDADK